MTQKPELAGCLADPERGTSAGTASTELKDFDKVHVAGLPLQAPMNYEQCGLRWRKCVRQQLFKD